MSFSKTKGFTTTNGRYSPISSEVFVLFCVCSVVLVVLVMGGLFHLEFWF